VLVLLAHGRLNEFASASSHEANNEGQFYWLMVALTNLQVLLRTTQIMSVSFYWLMVALTNLRVQRYKKLSNQQNILALFFENIYKEDAKDIPKIAEDRTFSSFGGSKKFEKKTQSRRKITVQKRKKASKRGIFFTLNRKSIAFSP